LRPTKESLDNLAWLVVGLVIVLAAGVLAILARFLGAGPKDVITLATAIAGLATVAVGLVLAWNASKLFYEKPSQDGATDKTALKNLVANVVAAAPAEKTIADAQGHLADARSFLAPAAFAGVTTDQQSALDSATSKISDAEASIGQIPIQGIDLNKLLPTLVTTAAGFAVALVLLGALMLVGSSVAAPTNSASPSPAASSRAAVATAAPTAS
jgi:hypothetical protein